MEKTTDGGDASVVVTTDDAVLQETSDTQVTSHPSDNANGSHGPATTPPAGFDLNFDGIPDASQAGVATVAAFHGRSLVTFDAGGHSLSDVESYAPTSRPNHDPR